MHIIRGKISLAMRTSARHVGAERCLIGYEKSAETFHLLLDRPLLVSIGFRRPFNLDPAIYELGRNRS